MSATTQVSTVITDWSAVSAFGVGAEAFRAGLLLGEPATAHDAPAGQRAAGVPGFDPQSALGRKGTRSMDRVTALAVTTTGHLAGRPAALPAGTALVLGTSGSTASTMDFTRSSLTGDKPFYVDAARFPNTVMNCAAGQCAIWHQLKGPNTTVAGGGMASLLALNYARRLHRSGRARTVVCGGAEEYSDARAWLHHHSTTGAAGQPTLGEGAAMLRLERAGSETGGPALAEVVALRFGTFARPAEAGPALASCVRRVIEAAGIDGADLAAVAAGLPDGLERSAVVTVLADHAFEWITPESLIGDLAAAAGAFRIVAALSWAEASPEVAGRLVLVTGADRDGGVGAALLRLPGTLA